jgi:hypothetical protein
VQPPLSPRNAGMNPYKQLNNSKTRPAKYEDTETAHFLAGTATLPHCCQYVAVKVARPLL